MKPRPLSILYMSALLFGSYVKAGLARPGLAWRVLTEPLRPQESITAPTADDEALPQAPGSWL